jgi:hypothetical protein
LKDGERKGMIQEMGDEKGRKQGESEECFTWVSGLEF